MGIATVGAAERDVIVEAAQVFEDMLEGIRDGPLEGAVSLALRVPEGAQQRTVFLGILDIAFLPASPGIG